MHLGFEGTMHLLADVTAMSTVSAAAVMFYINQKRKKCDCISKNMDILERILVGVSIVGISSYTLGLIVTLIKEVI